MAQVPTHAAPSGDRIRPTWRRVALVVAKVALVALSAAAAGTWIVVAGFLAVLNETFGAVDGWVWSIGYCLVAVVIVAAFWPFRGRRVLAGTGIALSILVGTFLAHSSSYTVGRIHQIIDNAPKPANARLISTTTQDGGFSPPGVYYTYVVPASEQDLIKNYGRALARAGWRLDSFGGPPQPERPSYVKGRLVLTLAHPWTADGGADPGHLIVEAWSR